MFEPTEEDQEDTIGHTIVPMKEDDVLFEQGISEGSKLKVVIVPANALKRKRDDNSDRDEGNDLKSRSRITNPMNVTVEMPDDKRIEMVIRDTTTVALILYKLREDGHLPKGTKCQIMWKGDELERVGTLFEQGVSDGSVLTVIYSDVEQQRVKRRRTVASQRLNNRVM